MGVFLDKNGVEVTWIDSSNVAEFRQWLQDEEKPESGRGKSLQISPDLSLDDILKNSDMKKIILSDKQQEYLAEVLAYASSFNEEWGKELMDNSARYPYLVGYAYRKSANTQRGILCFQIYEELGKRNFEDNILTFDAMLRIKNAFSYRDLGKGKIRKLSDKKSKILENIFDRMNQGDSDATEFMKAIAIEKILNYEKASPEMRKFINQRIFYDYETTEKSLKEMDEKFFTKEIFAQIIQKVGVRRPYNYHKTQNPQTQEEKNEGILPTGYLKLKSALVMLAQKEEIHDHNNYGREKSLTQRYKEMMAEICEVSDWEKISPETKNGLLEDVYLYVVQKDIDNNKAESLSKEDLKMVLAADKDNTYTRKLKNMLKNRPDVKLDREKYSIVHIEEGNIIENSAMDEKITYKEKIETLNAKEKMYNTPESIKKTEIHNQTILTYEEHLKQFNVLNKEERKSSFLFNYIKGIQENYKAIIRNFKKGIANPQEEFLQKENMEKLLQDFMQEKIVQIPFPEYKSLPLLIGRKEEKNRRENIRVCINIFNQHIKDYAENSMYDYRMGLDEFCKDYAGEILDEKSLKNIEQKNLQDIEKKRNLAKRISDEENDYHQAVLQEERKKQVLDKLQEVKENVEIRRNKMVEMSKEFMPVEPSKLQAVTTQNDDEKRVLRAQNKDVKDPLQDKAKKLEGKNDTERYEMIKKMKDKNLSK